MPSKKNKPIVFLFGPTASGKTELAINIADKFPIELISVDSVMVYKDCNIGSAKPTKEVLKEYPHHMIDIVSPNEVFTVADFCSFSKKLIKSAHSKKKLPVFVGGSMMYFKSLFEGIHDLPKRDEKYRKELKELKLNSNNNNFLFDMLKDIDSDYAKKVNKNDEVRIIRALEVFMITGKQISKILSEESNNKLSNDYEISQFAITHDRELLHKRIESRLDKIIEEGMLEEAEYLLKKYNIDPEHPLRKSVNYKQAFSYLNNEYKYDDFYKKALYATRQLAKRQITWLRSWKKFKEIKINQEDNLENSIKNLISLL